MFASVGCQLSNVAVLPNLVSKSNSVGLESSMIQMAKVTSENDSDLFFVCCNGANGIFDSSNFRCCQL